MRSTASVAKNIIPFNKCILETLLTTWVASGVASIFWGVAAATPCHPGSFATVVVVSPLVALMEDQVKEAEQLGVCAGQLAVHDHCDIMDGNFSLVFGSPESWLLNNT